ncbi:MAG TPA: endonuclease III [Candidatus Udaeobacter sp.]|nr:endonuclease III [Candidatus Udaeobacter sp.]
MKSRPATRAAGTPRGAGADHGLASRASRESLGRRTAAGIGARKSAGPKRATRRSAADPERVAAILGILERLYPDARSALNFQNPLQLLIATILSAQCTDQRVNQVTPALFERYPDAAAFAAAPQEELEAMIRSTGFFRNKARAIRECCADLVAHHHGQVPRTLEALTALKGVGRKTANVVLGNAFGIAGLVVDTHVTRVSRRLGLTREGDAVKIEFDLMRQVPEEKWSLFSHWLILHGRQVCIARKPRCSVCALLPHCPRVGVSVSE